MNKYRVKPGQKVDLGRWDPSDTGDFKGGKEEGKEALKPLTSRLEELQELLYAEHKHKVLIVLQARDAGGKDGTIRHVFDRVNPQGVKVASFKVPTPRELDHDYLWRIHRHVREFERLLAEEGTTILKFFLHIDRDEQKKRFQARLDDPHKQWKFSLGDLEERKLWDEYRKAYEIMLSETSTDWAPWYVIPANRKWYRNLAVSRIIIDALEKLQMAYPKPEDDLSGVVIE